MLGNTSNTVGNDIAANDSRRLASRTSSSSSLSSEYSSSSEAIDLDSITVPAATSTTIASTTATTCIESTSTKAENITTSTVKTTTTASVTQKSTSGGTSFLAPSPIGQSRGQLLKPSIPAPAFPSLNSPQRSASDRLGSNKPAKRLIKVPLAPGHSALDWARLKSSGTDLRGVPQLGRYTLADVRQHRTESDCWCVLHGRVYNITGYLPFHPGGKRDLLAIAGKDATKLFMETHGWVNADMMLDQCLVGFLVRDN
ncbi:cytochrome b5-like heme/steroid binding domain-containing protein [Syncephalis plumigaleata]|nr:cytochrome b5-like heme/steroid binding domain-containing protein [Syncephalis plumigaleata]